LLPSVEAQKQLWLPLSIAPTLVEAGYDADYERFRHEAIERHGRVTDPVDRVNLLRSCLLLPADETLLEKLRPHVEPIAAAVAKNEKQLGNAGWGAYALALQAWRAGDFAGSLKWSREGLASPIENQPRLAGSHSLAAMAAYRSGQVEVAQDDLEKAHVILAGTYEDSYTPRGGKSGNWADWAIARILEREASAVVGGGNVER
jgi:hypothetical protein